MTPLTFLRPLPRAITRPAAGLVLVGWLVTMGLLVHRTYVEASPANLATDLARYGPTAIWRGVYYRGEKIGFTVSQTTRTAAGFELQEDGRLQMLLLGQDTAATLRTSARVDTNFTLQDFDFSLDPGTGAIAIKGSVAPPGRPGDPYRLTLAITSAGATRTETRELPDMPVMSLNLSRILASQRLVPGTVRQWTVLDPATLQNAAMTIRVGERSVVRANDTSVPAFRVESEFRGLKTTSWITDTGEVVREESPLGLMTVRESPERARGLAVSDRVQSDLLRAAAIVPSMTDRIDDPRDVRRLTLRLTGADVPTADLDGAGQSLKGGALEILDPQIRKTEPLETDLAPFLKAEPLLESDAPEIRAEAEAAIHDAKDDRTRAERLTRHVNSLLDKKPTVSLPSALEVLRTKVGDCNEHTALFVAMARAIGLPARIDVGLVFMHGAFYYHAWPEVYVAESGRGMWLPVDPTLNQFPADATHVRLARGGLDKQAAILPLIGRLRITVASVEFAPGTDRVIVGRQTPAADVSSLPIAVPAAASKTCRCSRSTR